MVTADEIARFAQTEAEYYVRAWRRLQSSAGVSAGFNTAAFFFSFGWMLYRRMYDLAAAFGTILVLEAVASDWYFTAHLHLAEAPKSWDLLVRVVVAIAAGQFGNRWYIRYAERNIEYARERGIDLSLKGGTSSVAVLIGSVALLLAAGLAFVVVGFATGASSPQ